MYNKEAYAYIAGLFDGEGCIRITRSRANQRVSGTENPVYSLYLRVNMTDPRALCRIADAFGGPIYAGKRASGKHRTLYGWVATSRAAERFLQTIRPWLIVKAEEADLALDFQTHIRETKRHGRGRPHPPQVIATREGFYRVMSDLKHRQHEKPRVP